MNFLKKTYLFLSLLLTTCSVLKQNNNKTQHIGGFKEETYVFFNSIEHVTESDYYYDLPYSMKVIGVYPVRWTEGEEIARKWMRDPNNLMQAFQVAIHIGLERFISREDYFQPSEESCCDYEWSGKSPDEIVKGFLASDTSYYDDDDYYHEFWNRRREEGNLKEVYYILNYLNIYYNDHVVEEPDPGYHLPLFGRLVMLDMELMAAKDTTAYNELALKYFTELREDGLEYSAYKFIFHNKKISLSPSITDSLLNTLDYSLISEKEWEQLNDNYDGWINPTGGYIEPERDYGP